SWSRPHLLASSMAARERIAIGGRRDAQQALEPAAQGLGAAESARRGHLVETRARILEPLARRLHARAFDIARGRHGELAREGAGEVARAHPDPLRERLDAEIRLRVLVDPALELAQRGSGREGGSELDAEL